MRTIIVSLEVFEDAQRLYDKLTKRLGVTTKLWSALAAMVHPPEQRRPVAISSTDTVGAK